MLRMRKCKFAKERASGMHSWVCENIYTENVVTGHDEMLVSARESKKNEE